MAGRSTPLSFNECLKEIDMFFQGKDEVHKTLRRLVPNGSLSRPWRKDLRGHVLRDGPHLRQAVQFAQTHQLHERVAQCCCLVWPGDHRYIERIGQPLVEPCVACAAAQHMHSINYSTS